MSTEPTRDDGMVELNFWVELDPEDPRVVVMDCGVPPRVKMKFDTQEDAKRADTLLTMFARAFYVMFNVCGAVPAEEPTTWAPGTPAPSTQKAHSAEGGAEKGDGAVNATKTQKDGVLSFGADGAAQAEQRRETVTNCNGFGNVAKIREALVEAVRLFETAVARSRWAEELVWLDEAKAALSVPRRNYERFENGREAMNAFDHGGCPGDCAECIYDDYPERKENCEHCEVNWLFDTVAPEKVK